MLETINGFDLLLVIIIVMAGFKIYNLNRECESYVQQILRLSWDLQAEIQENVMWENKWQDCEPPQPAFKNDCVYCAGIEDFITGDECICPPF
jgi:hypothetical protein